MTDPTPAPKEATVSGPIPTDAAPPLPILTRDQILEKDDITISEPIEVEEWGGAIHIRTMSGKLREKHEKHLGELAAKAEKTGNAIDPRGERARFLVDTICDAGGKPLFTEEDIQALTLKNGVVIDRLSTKAMALNGTSEEALGDAEKN